MFRVLSCLTTAHDPRLVALALIVCFVACLAAVVHLHRAHATQGRVRAAWIATAGAATGCGIWSTHFIAMLAYEPVVEVGYGVGLTSLSFIAAVTLASAGIGVAVYGARRCALIAGGTVLGAGIALMHYLGMAALDLPGHIVWSIDLVAASILLGIVFAVAALGMAVHGNDIRHTFAAAALLVLAIASHHFTAMGAAGITPDPLRELSPSSLAPLTLAFGVAAATAAVIIISAVGALVDQRLCEQGLQLDTALNNMRQAVLMFDADSRLVLWNKQYPEMYRLPPQALRLRLTARELLALRAAAGTFAGDPDHYIAAYMHAGMMAPKLVDLPDGRTIAVLNRPMPGGGWVSTHEDVTEERQVQKALEVARAEAEAAEAAARAAHARLLDAFEVVPEGLAVFDADDRYVLWNRRYAEIYGEVCREIRQGMRFEDMLRAGLALGRFPDAEGREEEWLKDRLAHHAESKSSHEQRLPGDRWLRIDERRTADGGSIGVRIDITELKRREASFRLLFENNPVSMWVYDRETLRVLAVNDAAIEHYGYSRERFLAMSLLDFRPAEDRDELCRIAGTGDGNYVRGRTWRHLKADGTQIDVAIYSRALLYEGRAASLVAAIDVTERKRAEDEVRRTRAFLNTVIDNMPVTVFVKDAQDLKLVLMNKAGQDLFSASRDEWIGKTVYDVLPKAQADIVYAHDREALAGQTVVETNQEIDTPHKGVRQIASRRMVVRDENGNAEYLLAVIEDVTERERAEARIKHLAHHDVVTGLPNRVAFTETLARTLERAAAAREKFAILCIDLDRFKEVNDVFGHSVGDALLREVSARLDRAREGALLARVGGDEFILISTAEPHPEATERLAARLRTVIDEDIGIAGNELRINLSIGVAIFPTDGTDATTLLANADAALYRAKAEGRGTVRFFEAEMDKRLRERRALQQELRSAIARNEFVLHYQPQFRIGGEIIGFEALLRWNHPTRGSVPPSTFIPLADENGLIVALTEWILREACREAASWPQPLNIAVNLSPTQFHRGDLPRLVHTVLLECGLAPNRLELEVTEGVLIDDFSRALSVLRRIKALGVRIAMDDFGTGYSSLSYLQSFPFDKIKIDASFIANVERNAQSGAIVRAIIGLARGLGVPVLAEGVETREQLAFLAREGCDEVQGFLFGRPYQIEEYVGLTSHSPARPRRLTTTSSPLAAVAGRR